MALRLFRARTEGIRNLTHDVREIRFALSRSHGGAQIVEGAARFAGAILDFLVRTFRARGSFTT